MRNASDNDNQGQGSKLECECQIWGKKTQKLKKIRPRLIICFKYMSLVSRNINVLVCETSSISHTT